jgi:predicted SAM-dependent methyltransferase
MHRVGESRLKPIVWRARQLRGRMMARLMTPLEASRLRRMTPLRLNVGCGAARFPGWVNIDVIPGADLTLNVTKGLPFDDRSVDLIYNEHFMEHLTLEDAENVLRDFKRCLKVGGILRIAMPDLDALVENYSRDWKDQDWLTPGSKAYSNDYEFIKSRGRMLNWTFYGRPMFSSSHRDPYGHKYLYNEEDLRNLLFKMGFKRIVRCERNRSSCGDLCNLETRADSKLVMEACVE